MVGRIHVGERGGKVERKPNFTFYCAKLIGNSHEQIGEHVIKREEVNPKRISQRSCKRLPMGWKKWDREAADHCFDLIDLTDLVDSLNYVLA